VVALEKSEYSVRATVRSRHSEQSIRPEHYRPAVSATASLAALLERPALRSDLFAAFLEAPLDSGLAWSFRESPAVPAVASDR
jgi:hypothetical protein